VTSAERSRPRVVMVAPSRRVRGGVTSVVNSLLAALPEDAPSIAHVATHVDGPKLLKVCAAITGTVGVLWAVTFGRRPPPRLQASIKRTLERANLVIALSDEWSVRLKRIAPGANIRVLPNPVVVDDFSPTLENRPEVPSAGGTVLFLGAFGKRKGVYDLLDAIPAVAAARREVLFEMGGDQEVAEVRGLVDEKGIERNVRMLGWVSGDDKLAAFTRAHIYVLPSYHEGLPIGVLEAMAAGLPVVTTPVGGIPEVVRDGVNGIIISPGDVRALSAAVLRLLEDAELRKRMSEANVELVRSRHDAPLVAATLCEWYNEIWSG